MKGIIFYTSGTGVTEDVAKYIQNKVHYDLEIFNVSSKEGPLDFTTYDFYIVGSPTYISMASKPIRNFVKENINSFITKPLYLFMIGANEEVDLQETLPQSYPQEILQHAKIIEFLGGELRFHKLGFLKRFLLKKIEQSKIKENPNHKSPLIFWEKVDQFCIDLENDLTAE